MFNKLLAGQEKAIIGGAVAGILALLGQVGVNSQITLKEGIAAVVTWLVTHAFIWLTTNTSKV